MADGTTIDEKVPEESAPNVGVTIQGPGGELNPQVDTQLTQAPLSATTVSSVPERGLLPQDSAHHGRPSSGASTSGAQKRAPSPSAGTRHTQASALEFKVSSQRSRQRLMEIAETEACHLDPAQLTLVDINGRIELLDEQWNTFAAVHEEFSEIATPAFFENSYMTGRVYENCYLSYKKARVSLVNRRSAILSAAQLNSANQSAGATSSQVAANFQRLPMITMPEFSGDYIEWPSFRDMFTSMVMSRTDLSLVMKLHYLKTSTKGEAAQLIADLPVTAESFETAWQLLTRRFENKRLLVSAEVEKLVGCQQTLVKSASALNNILNVLTRSMNALNSLVSSQELGHILVVYNITARLDSSTREAWEVSLGDSAEPPTLDQLRSFIAARARALENLESSAPGPSTSGSSSSRPSSRSAMSRPGSRNSTQSKAHQKGHGASVNISAVAPRTFRPVQFPCVHCQGTHFIVTCPSFRTMSSEDRRKVVLKHALCTNCLGNHDDRVCKSKYSCKACGQRHHTMLHLQSSQSASSQAGGQPASSAQPEQH